MEVQQNLSPNYTDNFWGERPPKLNSFIQERFDILKLQSNSNWGLFNGEDSYGICGVEINELFVLNLAKNLPLGQKKCYILDIGAGNFQCGDYLAKKINELCKSDMKFKIISVRGEEYLGPEKEKTGKCTIVKLGKFKVENIFAEFKKRNMKLVNKIDLAFSSQCMHHLCDSPGTFLQTYELLKPGKGIFASTGFYFNCFLNEQNPEEKLESCYAFNWFHMFFILNGTGSKFLLKNLEHNSDAQTAFILQRNDDQNCPLDLEYLGVIDRRINDRRGCFTWVKWKNFKKNYELLTKMNRRDLNIVYGDADLHKEIAVLDPKLNSYNFFPLTKISNKLG